MLKLLTSCPDDEAFDPEPLTELDTGVLATIHVIFVDIAWDA